jgi:hypothetical protein
MVESFETYPTLFNFPSSKMRRGKIRIKDTFIKINHQLAFLGSTKKPL